MKLEILEFLPETNRELPALLFVHGASHGAWCWKEHFLPYFSSKGFPSYALSYRGHGASEGYEDLASFSLKDYIDDVIQVINTLPSKPILIGHSMGGAIVQNIMQKCAEKILGVALLASTSPNGMLKEWAKIVFTRLPLVYKMYLFNKGKNESFPDELLFSPELSVEKRENYGKLLQREALKAAEEMIRQNLQADSRVKNVPVLVLGSKKDRFFSEKIAVKTAKFYNTEPIIFSNMSHDMMLDPNWLTVAEELLHFFTSFTYEPIS